MAIADCIAAIAARFPKLGRKSLERIGEEMEKRVERLQREGFTYEEALDRAADDIAKDIEIAAAMERRQKLINIRTFNRLMRFAEDVDAQTGNPAMAVEARLVGVNAPFAGGRQSVSAEFKTLEKTYLANLYSRLEKEDLFTYVTSHTARETIGGSKFTNVEHDIANELEHLTKPSAAPSGVVLGVPRNMKAKRAAEIIHEVRELARQRENAAGGYIKKLPGYITRVSHNQARVRKVSFEEWRDDVLPLLDRQATFGSDDPEEFLRSVYESITTGVHLKSAGIEEADTFFRFEGPGNLAKRSARHRVLQWRNADGWIAYHSKYGKGGLMDSVAHDLRRHARNTALMRNFGPNPEAMIDRWKQALKQQHRDKPKVIDKLNGKLLKAYTRIITGEADIQINPTLAGATQTLINIKSMASLGAAGVSAVGDVIFRGADARALGLPFFRGLSEGFRDIMRGAAGLTPKELKRTGDLLHVGLDTQMGNVLARFHSPDQVAGKMTRLMRLYFVANRLGPITDAAKRGHARMLALHLAHKSEDGGWDQLDNLTRRWLLQYGMTEKHWPALRQMVVEAPDGKMAMLPDLARELPDDVVRPLADGISETALDRARAELEINLSRFYTDRAEFASPTPGARERGILSLGTAAQPGTAWGTAQRLMTLFKGFPAAVAMRPLGQLIHGTSNGRADMVGLLQLMVSGVAAGWGIMSAKALIDGRTPPDPNDVGNWAHAVVQGGAGSIFADLIFGEHQKYGRGLLESLGGPVFGVADDLAEIGSGLVRGENRWGQLLRTITTNVPGQNLFYFEAALNYLFLYSLQEAVNPGSIRRMERSIEREQGSEFFFPPSQAVN